MNEQKMREEFEKWAKRHLTGAYGLAQLMWETAWQAALSTKRQAGEPEVWMLVDEEGDREFNSVDQFSFGRSGGIPLYTTPPLSRDVLMRVAEAVRDECREARGMYGEMGYVNTDAIVDALPSSNGSVADELERVYDEFGIGTKARDISTPLANIGNVKRRAECLSAIEREFFMVRGEVDDDHPDQEPDDECLLNWAHEPGRYVEAFRVALRAIAGVPQPEPVNQQMLAAMKLAHPYIHTSAVDGERLDAGMPVEQCYVNNIVADAIAAAESAQAQQPQAVGVPDGWHIVPSSAHKLLLSGDIEMFLHHSSHPDAEIARIDLYNARQAMTAAAPKPEGWV